MAFVTPSGELDGRDKEIKKVLELIKAFGDRHGLDLPCYGSRFDAETIIISNGKAHHEMDWIRREAISIGDNIVRHISEKAILQLSAISNTSDILRGSSWAVATKLVARLMFGINNWYRDIDGPDFYAPSGEWEHEYMFDKDFVSMTGVSFSRIVDRVAEIYEEEYMRYRLWREEDVKSLYRFLFVGADSHEFFERGALEWLLCNKEKLSVDGFVDAVTDVITDLPTSNSTELEYPETRERLNMYGFKWRRKRGDVSCIFSEYAPVENMDKDLLMWLYDCYVEDHKAYKA